MSRLLAHLVAMAPFVAVVFALREQWRTRRRAANTWTALNFPLPGVAEELARSANISIAEAERREREFRRWFVVAAASPVVIGMGSRRIDEFWHVLLRHPDLYEKFSRAVAGTVVRHIEGIGGERLEARSWVAYETVWREAPPAEFWDRPDEAALARVRVATKRRTTADAGGDGGEGFVSLSLSDGYSHDGCHDAGSHGDSSGHGCGGHGCGGSGCGGH